MSLASLLTAGLNLLLELEPQSIADDELQSIAEVNLGSLRTAGLNLLLELKPQIYRR